MKVAVIGHRRFAVTPQIQQVIYEQLEGLINQGAEKFCFAFKGAFFDSCHGALSEFKENYHIKLVYYRAVYPGENDGVADSLATLYGQKYFDESVCKEGADDVNKRNQFMIDDCGVLFTLFDKKLNKSATAEAVAYAKQKGKKIINVLDLI